VYKKVKDFVVKNWQWLITSIVAIVFYIIGRSKDAKDEEVKLAVLSKELEQKKTQEIIEGWEAKSKEKDDSLVENILQFEEKKAKILEDAGDIDIEEYLRSKGIIEDETNK
tara:strand:- start:525 stop:857 length:333 start_codon:yes stop_codon:yes gene_type:complete